MGGWVSQRPWEGMRHVRQTRALRCLARRRRRGHTLSPPPPKPSAAPGGQLHVPSRDVPPPAPPLPRSRMRSRHPLLHTANHEDVCMQKKKPYKKQTHPPRREASKPSKPYPQATPRSPTSSSACTNAPSSSSVAPSGPSGCCAPSAPGPAPPLPHAPPAFAALAVLKAGAGAGAGAAVPAGPPSSCGCRSASASSCGRRGSRAGGALGTTALLIDGSTADARISSTACTSRNARSTVSSYDETQRRQRRRGAGSGARHPRTCVPMRVRGTAWRCTARACSSRAHTSCSVPACAPPDSTSLADSSRERCSGHTRVNYRRGVGRRAGGQARGRADGHGGRERAAEGGGDAREGGHGAHERDGAGGP